MISWMLGGASVISSIVFYYMLLQYVSAPPEIWILWLLQYVFMFMTGVAKALEEG